MGIDKESYFTESTEKIYSIGEVVSMRLSTLKTLFFSFSVELFFFVFVGIVQSVERARDRVEQAEKSNQMRSG